MAGKLAQLPPITIPWVDESGTPTTQFGPFMVLFAGGNIGPLVSAANDAAAAKAGVSIGQLYQDNGSVRIRLA